MSQTPKLSQRPATEPFDIYIVGTGIIPGYHLTREAEAALRRSKEILYVDKSFGFEELLQGFCGRLTDLHAAGYREGKNRIDSYRDMSAMVIDAALDHPPVSLALYGHPLVYALPPFIVAAASKLMSLKVKVVAGVSSLDTMFIDLMIDPSMQGLQMYEATDLLLRRRPLQPDVPCLLWQVGSLGTRLYSEGRNRRGRFAPLRDYLLQFYPPDHEMTAVYSASMPLAPASRTSFTLDTIDDVAESMHQGATVYIPAVQTRAIVDESLARLMDERTHLEEITEARA